MLNTVNETIKAYLDKRGIKQKYIAQLAGMSPNTLSAILNGKRQLLADEYFTICKALEVPLDTFVSGGEG